MRRELSTLLTSQEMRSLPLGWFRGAPKLIHRPDRKAGESDADWYDRVDSWEIDVCQDELGYGVFAAVGPDIKELYDWARKSGDYDAEDVIEIVIGDLDREDFFELARQLATLKEDFNVYGEGEYGAFVSITLSKSRNNPKPKQGPPILTFLIIGKEGIGKTKLIRRFLKDEYNEEEELGSPLAFPLRGTPIGKKLDLRVFEVDPGNEERGIIVAQMDHIKGAPHLGGFAFDITQLETFEHAIEQAENFRNQFPEIICLLIATKTDLEKKRKVSEESIKKELKRVDFVSYFKTSAKTGKGIKELLNAAAELLMEKCKIKSS